MSGSGVLRVIEGDRLGFHCPGCDAMHVVQVGNGPEPRWWWNGSTDKPTFTPSVLVSWTWGEKHEPRCCHSFVRDGQIQFLNDCTHSLADKTVPLEKEE